MVASRVFALIALVVLLSAPGAEAKKCRTDSQCGKCGICFAGQCAIDPLYSCAPCEECDPSTFRCKPAPFGTPCGGCGTCDGRRCTANDSFCGLCQMCDPTTRTCVSAPDGPSSQCGPGTSCCGGQCVNTQEDSANCGSCGHVCPEGQSCELGSCKCPGTGSPCGSSGTCCDPAECKTCGGDGTCRSNCGACETCNATTGQCEGCGSEQLCCQGQCVSDANGRPDPAVCCSWNGQPHACADGEQCAGPYCCAGGTEVCVPPNGNAQCCSGNLVCQAGRCCYPGSPPACSPEACCDNG